MASTGLVYVGPVNVERKDTRISTPEAIIEAGILEVGEEAWWSFEDVSGTIVVSNNELQGDEYTSIAARKVQQTKNRIRIPSPLIENPSRDVDKFVQNEAVHPDAILEPGKRYHFVYRTDGMAEGETRSCYLFDDKELAKRLSTPDDWEGNHSSVPDLL